MVVPNCSVDAAKARLIRPSTRMADGTVVDGVRHLMWEKTVDAPNASPPPRFGLPKALGCCGSLRLTGYDDWRLPSAVELQSSVDYGHSAPSIDGTVFPNTQAGTSWTLTAVVDQGTWSMGMPSRRGLVGDSAGHRGVSAEWDRSCGDWRFCRGRNRPDATPHRIARSIPARPRPPPRPLHRSESRLSA